MPRTRGDVSRIGALGAWTAALAIATGGAPVLAVGRPHEPRVSPADVRNAELLGAAEQRLREGNAELALEALWAIDDARPTLDRFARARLLGVASFACARHDDARAALEEARTILVQRGRTLRADLEILRARAEHARGACGQALAALERAGPAGRADPEAVLVEGACLADGGLRAAAIDALSAGIALRADPRLFAARARVLLELGAHAAARDDARAAAASGNLETALAVQDALVEAGALAEATAIARALRRRWPDDARPLAALARLATGREAALAAVDAARLEPRHRADAAELLRRDGAVGAAQREAAGIAEGPTRLRARLASLVDARAWDRALALRQPLDDAGLGADDAVRYALAYAAFSVGDDNQASALLDDIEDPSMFERASRLRVAIAACADEGTPCVR